VGLEPIRHSSRASAPARRRAAAGNPPVDSLGCLRLGLGPDVIAAEEIETDVLDEQCRNGRRWCSGVGGAGRDASAKRTHVRERVPYCRRIFSIAFPLASSSMSLSR